MDAPFRDLSALTRWLRGLLLANAALGVVSTAADLDEKAVASSDTLDTIQMVTAVAQLVALFVTFVVAGIWIYRAAQNARALGAQRLTIEPGWAVGYYFLPIANLFKPYQAMSEIWRASANPVAWEGIEVPSRLPFWWAAWLISGFLDLVVAKLPASDSPATMPTIVLTVVSNVADVAAFFAFFAVVGGLWNLQDRARLRTMVDQVFSGPEAHDVATRKD